MCHAELMLPLPLRILLFSVDQLKPQTTLFCPFLPESHILS